MALLVTLGLLCVLHGCWPGDIQFLNDEPLLIENALSANARGGPVALGLMGSHGAFYGPLPTWLYQLWLAFSHDLVWLAACRGVLTAASIAAALLWLSASTGLWPWFAAVILCSPYLWYSDRTLWDNTFCQPLAALGFAGYAAFAAHGSRLGLASALAACVGLSLVHLMSLAFVAALGLNLLVFHRRALWRERWLVAVVVGVGLGIGAPYYRQLLTGSSQGIVLGGPEAWLFALSGAQLVSAEGIDAIFGSRWLAADASAWGVAARAAISASRLAFVLSWVGLAVAAWALLRRRLDPRRAHAAALALSLVAAQMVLNGLSDRWGYWHYFNATWIATAVLAWLGIDAARRVPGLAAALAGTLGACLLFVTVYLAVRIHTGGASRDSYGATLANQLAVVRELRRHAPGPLRIEVGQYRRFPHALETLLRIVPRASTPAPALPLRVRYLSDDPDDGRIQVVRGR
jgi:hypothetical protein